MPQIEVRNGDLLTFEGDGIMVPSVSSGAMNQGIAARIRKAIGEIAEREISEHAPIAVGACIVTEISGLSIRYLIHAPVVEEPGVRIGVENIRRSVRATLLGASKYEMERIAIPGFGYGEAAVSHEECARAIIDEVTGFKGHQLPASVVLIDDDDEMHEAFEIQISTK